MPEELQQPPTPASQNQSKLNIKKVMTAVVVVALVTGLLGGLIYTFNSNKLSAKEKLKQVLPKEGIDEIENDEADQNAQSNVRKLATAVEVCSTILIDKNVQSKDIYTNNNGCADNEFLVSNDYLTEELANPTPVIVTDSENSIICIWAKGGSINQNHWAFFVTEPAIIILESNSSESIKEGMVSVVDLSSDPKGCRKV